MGKRLTKTDRIVLYLIAFFGTLICAAFARAQEIGPDMLGIKRGPAAWNCPAMLQSWNSLPGRRPGGAFVGDTFGTDESCIRAWLATGNVDLFRGHLAWTNHQSVPYIYLIPAAQFMDRLQVEFPGTRICVSHICEHNMTSQQSAQLFDQLKPYMPHINCFVDSGMSQWDPRAIHECHGPTKICPAKSLDGQSAFDVDNDKFKRTAQLYAMEWDISENCKFSDLDKRAPNVRTDCPNQDLFNLLVRIHYPQPPFPPGEKLGPSEIWKPKAENYGGCKGRDCRPVAILNINVPFIAITTLDGRGLGIMVNGGKYGRNQRRYYLGGCPRPGQCGSQQTAFVLGQQAESMSGSEFVVLKAGNRRIVVNAYRRGGVVRTAREMKALRLRETSGGI